MLDQDPTYNCLFAEFTNIVKTDSSGAALRMTLCFLLLLYLKSAEMTRNIYCHTERSEVSFFGKNFCWVKPQPTTLRRANSHSLAIATQTDSSGAALRMTRNIYCHTERSEVSLFGEKDLQLYFYLTKKGQSTDCPFSFFIAFLKLAFNCFQAFGANCFVSCFR